MADIDEKKNDIEMKEELDFKQACVDSCHTLLEKDKSLPTLFEIFSTLLTRPNFAALCTFVQKLGVSVGKMFEYIPNLVGFAGQEEIDGWFAVTTQFCDLLIMTKQALKNVSEQAMIQQESMEDMIENIENIDKDKFDKKEFQDSITTLAQWISDKAIAEMIVRWTTFCKICQKRHLKWQQLIKNSKGKTRNDASVVLKGFGLMAIVGGVIATAVAAVVLLPVVIPSAAMVTGFVGTGAAALVSVEVAPLLLYGGLGALAVGLLSGGAGMLMDGEGQVVAVEILKQAETIRDSLKQMLLFGKKIKNDLNDLNDIKTENIAKRYEELQNNESRKRILRASKTIVEYLKEYQIEGKKIIENVTQAQTDIVAKLERM